VVRTPVRDMLEQARLHLDRLSPADAHGAQRTGALLVDVRTEAQRRDGGEVPDATVVPLNVLEWRLDPDEPLSLAPAGDFGRQVILLCQEGFCSSLAADRLRRLGYARATDVTGGFVAWTRDGLPVSVPHEHR
jgi:rhodanese-related sulfurtransferase